MVPRWNCIFPGHEGVEMIFKRFFQMTMMISLVVLSACAGNPSREPSHQAFPPSSLLPLNVVISRPIAPAVHQADHEALEVFSESPGRRLLLMNCAWGDGLKNMVQMMVPGTQITYLGQDKNPLGAIGPGVLTQQDSLGRVHFSLDGHSTLDLARHRGWTHLVVPYDIRYLWSEDGEYLALSTPAAIIDVLEQRIVWQGTIDSGKIPEKILGKDDSRRPPLTAYESTTYRFVLELSRIMNRQLSPGPDSRHQLASPCQHPPPLLDQ